ncbi:hypothetical protein V8G54_016193 [Vigna mungo]|uniref:Uncharacterized protein n=1 Tax=Vigna mungo TaxID=3915 RepID=A0AAQ3NNK3_VIGMU
MNGIGGHNLSGHCFIASKLVNSLPISVLDENLNPLKKQAIDKESQTFLKEQVTVCNLLASSEIEPGLLQVALLAPNYEKQKRDNTAQVSSIQNSHRYERPGSTSSSRSHHESSGNSSTYSSNISSKVVDPYIDGEQHPGESRPRNNSQRNNSRHGSYGKLKLHAIGPEIGQKIVDKSLRG